MILISTTLISPSHLQATQAADGFESAPSNRVEYTNGLSKSLGLISCGTKNGVGLAGNWNISQDMRNSGINTLFLSTKTVIDQCIGSYRSLTPGGSIVYESQNYNLKKWGANLDGTDFATVATSLAVPTKDLWDDNFPQIGWWVMIAYYAPSFGIVFKESQIELVNKEELVLGVNAVNPVPIDDGIVFDNRGNFLGMITKLGNPIASGLLKVHGAPRQCQTKGTYGGTVTNCSIDRERVWSVSPSIPATTPKPSPSPTNSIADAMVEARDAYSSALSAYKLYTAKVVACLEAFKGRNASERRMLSLVSGSQICSSENSTAKTANDQMLSLGQSISSSRDPLGLITQFNNFTDTFNLSAMAMDDAISMANNLSSLYADFEGLENSLLVFTEQLDDLDYVLSNLPTRVTALIKKGIAFDYVEENRALVEEAETQFDEAQSEINGITYPDPEAIDDFSDSIKVIIRGLPSETTFSRTLQRALDAIPAFYCKKGTRATLPKKGKCASGFSRVKIDKG